LAEAGSTRPPPTGLGERSLRAVAQFRAAGTTGGSGMDLLALARRDRPAWGAAAPPARPRSL